MGFALLDGIIYIHFLTRSMILLDIDNLNILVLFILAFISFKGYQADAQVFDSESED